MATETSEDLDLNLDDLNEEAAPTRKFDLSSKKFKIFALLLIVMSVEAIAIYFVLPKPSGPDGAADGATGLVGENDDASSDLDKNIVEVDVGKFDCTNSKADAGTAVHVTFNLVAIVAKGQDEDFREAVTQEHKNRVRQAVVAVCRSSSLDDLYDPEIGVIKRRIRETVNKVLGQSYIKEVVLSDFKTMEQ